MCCVLNVYSPLVQGDSICKWADDSQRLILEHFDTINNSPSQIYCSALPLSPSSSWLPTCYTPELLQGPKVVKGAEAEWGRCFRTVSTLAIREMDFSSWNNTIAAGSESGKIIILSAITGSQVAVLSGHTNCVVSLAFSLDGRSLVSGSCDKTVKLWDMQTGGNVKTFHGHIGWVYSVSISEDFIRIASGSGDWTIRLWDIQTGECLHTIYQQAYVSYVTFSPLNPQHIFSISGGKIWECNIDGHQIPSTYDGSYIIFSPDHAQFALCNGNDVTVQNSYSRAIVAKLHVADGTEYYCFSPDGRFIAAAAGKSIYVWDITSHNPHLVEPFISYPYHITSLVFSSLSSLVSTSMDRSVKFWKIGALSTDKVTTNAQSAPLSSAVIKSISLQVRDGIAVSSDSAGVVKTWDISNGICKAFFQTPAGNSWTRRDAKLIDNRLIFVWYDDDKIHIWETEKGKLLQTLNAPELCDLRISGDGSKIICLSERFIKAWSMWTWEPVCKIKLDLLGGLYLDFLCTDSPRIWACSMDEPVQKGWDFGTPSSFPVSFDPSTGRPHLDFISNAWWKTGSPPWIEDAVTGKRVFRLSGKYAMPNDVQWDGRFLVTGYKSGEVLIFDFYHILSQVIKCI